MEYSFDIAIAQEYGVNEAIFIKNMQFWIVKNMSNGTNRHDDRTWTYNSYSAFNKLFPFWTARQIRYMTQKLITKGVILAKKFKESEGDCRNWYSFKDEEKFIEPSFFPSQLTNKEPSKSIKTYQQCDKIVIEGDKSVRGVRQNCHPIPLYTDNKHKQIYTNCESQEEKKIKEPKPPSKSSRHQTFKYFLTKLQNGQSKGSDIKDLPLDMRSEALLAFFSHKTDKKVLPVPSNLKHLTARLNEGVDEADIRSVMMMKYHQWKDDDKMSRYVRISTLLRPSKFHDYLSELKTLPEEELQTGSESLKYCPQCDIVLPEKVTVCRCGWVLMMSGKPRKIKKPCGFKDSVCHEEGACCIPDKDGDIHYYCWSHYDQVRPKNSIDRKIDEMADKIRLEVADYGSYPLRGMVAQLSTLKGNRMGLG